MVFLKRPSASQTASCQFLLFEPMNLVESQSGGMGLNGRVLDTSQVILAHSLTTQPVRTGWQDNPIQAIVPSDFPGQQQEERG